MTTVVLHNTAPGLAPEKVRLELQAEEHALVATDIPAEELEAFLTGLWEEVGEFELLISAPQVRAGQMRPGFGPKRAENAEKTEGGEGEKF